MKRFTHTKLSGEKIPIAAGDITVLGPSLELFQCELLIKGGSDALTIVEVLIRESVISTQKNLKNFRFYDARIERSRFSGRYTGCGFGSRPDHYNPKGGIVGCDFTQATLDMCDFMNCDMSTLTLPKWPTITFLYPLRREMIDAVKWPGLMKVFVSDVLFTRPAGTAAICISSPSFQKKFKVSEADLKAVLEGLPDVLF